MDEFLLQSTDKRFLFKVTGAAGAEADDDAAEADGGIDDDIIEMSDEDGSDSDFDEDEDPDKIEVPGEYYIIVCVPSGAYNLMDARRPIKKNMRSACRTIFLMCSHILHVRMCLYFFFFLHTSCSAQARWYVYPPPSAAAAAAARRACDRRDTPPSADDLRFHVLFC